MDMSNPMFLTLNEVIERYRGQISEGTLRNWRSMRVGPSFLKVGKAVLYPQCQVLGAKRKRYAQSEVFRV